jgi:signal transduction histidine kinase
MLLFNTNSIYAVYSFSHGYGKQVPITFEVAPNVCDAVITDEEWLWQMLLNLLTNACKYTDRGSIHVSVRVDPTITLSMALHDALLFEVIDTGEKYDACITAALGYC